MMRKPKFEVFKGDDGQYYVRLKAANGRKLMVSEAYVSRTNAERAKTTITNAAVVAFWESGLSDVEWRPENDTEDQESVIE